MWKAAQHATLAHARAWRSWCILFAFVAACVQGRKRNIFQRWQSHFPDFFPGVKCFFPVENSQFGRPKTNFSGFQKTKTKTHKKVLFKFCNFSFFHFLFSTFHFLIFLLFHSIVPFFLASLFPVGLQKFPGGGGEHSGLHTPCLLHHCVCGWQGPKYPQLEVHDLWCHCQRCYRRSGISGLKLWQGFICE